MEVEPRYFLLVRDNRQKEEYNLSNGKDGTMLKVCTEESIYSIKNSYGGEISWRNYLNNPQ